MNGEEFQRQTMLVRETLKAANIGSAFYLRVSAGGRVQDGEVLITYQLSADTYFSNAVSGDTLEAVLDEFMHRQGWNARHAPLALSPPEIPVPLAEDIPF